MTELVNLYGMTLDWLENYAVELGFKKYSGRQIFQWMYQKDQYDFDQMTNLSQNLRVILNRKCQVCLPQISKIRTSVDGTIKYLLKLEDGHKIEAVKIPDEDRLTLCLSSQVGCALGCRFCKTGQIGFQRNLWVGEIIGQVALIRRALKPKESITNLVFMGMGEPLLNYENLKTAIDILTSELAYQIAHRKITISTAGLVPGIYRLSDGDLKVGLAVSLNSADQKIRNMLMPISKKYPLAELQEAVRYYALRARRRITFEYLLISGVTDTISAAKKLVAFVAEIPCKINLINYNPAEGLPAEFKPSREEDLIKFRDYLYPRTPAVTIRVSKGADIMAACGQLAGQA